MSQPAETRDACAAASDGLPPLLGLWKSRLPLIVVPVLAGLHRHSLLRGGGPPGGGSGGAGLQACEAGLLLAIALATGRLRLPFSVTWWLVLLAAFALNTELLLGVAAVLSLTVLLGWYGLRLFHPCAVSALWGGTRLKCSPQGLELACWWLWDLVVHLVPGCLVLCWHGPRLAPHGPQLHRGTATPLAVAVALPLNVWWLWGLGAGLSAKAAAPRLALWPLGMQLEDTNAVYRVAPKLPKVAWLWVYGAHWFVCTMWLAALLLPREVLFAYAVFTLFGLIRQPYTCSWLVVLLAALGGRGAWPLLEAVACCCAGTLTVSYYGAQLLAPHAFMALVRAWVVEPLQRWGPPWLSALADRLAAEPAWFWALSRLGDACLHLVPATLAVFLFWRRVTVAAALASLPTNLLWLFASRSCTLADTNRSYRIRPDLPASVWLFIYSAHWVGCALVALACLAHELLAVDAAAPPLAHAPRGV